MMPKQSKKLSLGLLFIFFLSTQIQASNPKTISKNSTLEDKTYTRSFKDFEMIFFPEGEKNGLLNVAKEAKITIISSEDKTINSIELELDLPDETAKSLVNTHGLFKSSVKLANDFRGKVSWTLHASEELKKFLTTHFQASDQADPIDVFLKKRNYFSANSLISFSSYKMYMSFNMPLSIQSNTYSYRKFVVLQPTEDKKYIEILLHKVAIFIEKNEENKVTKMSVKGLVSTNEFNEEYKDVPVFKSIALTAENTGENKFIAVEFQAEPRLRKVYERANYSAA